MKAKGFVECTAGIIVLPLLCLLFDGILLCGALRPAISGFYFPLLVNILPFCLITALFWYGLSRLSRFTMDENGVSIQNRWYKKQNRSLSWEKIMRVSETAVFFGYSAQECYLFSSDTGRLPPFQGIHSYFKRADIVVIPKNTETTACLEHYKIYRLNTCALYQNTDCPCSGKVYPPVCRIYWTMMLILFLALGTAFATAGILSNQYALIIVGIFLIIVALYPMRQIVRCQTQWKIDETGVYVSNPHYKSWNRCVSWSDLVQVHETALTLYYSKSNSYMDCYLLSDQPFTADWDYIGSYIHRGILCLPRCEEVKRCIVRYGSLQSCKIGKK